MKPDKLICPECLAECPEPKHFNRFIKRHLEGKICKSFSAQVKQADRSFNEGLSSGVRSVEFVREGD